MEAIAFTIDLLGGGSQLTQNLFQQPQRRFALVADHPQPGDRWQVGLLTQIPRPHQDPQPGVQLGGQPDHFVGHFRRIGGQHQGLGPLDPRGHQRVAMFGGPIHRRPALPFQPPHRFKIPLDNQGANPIFGQQLADRLAHRPIPHHHRQSPPVIQPGLGQWGGPWRRLVPAFRSPSTVPQAEQPGGQVDDHGTECHRDQRGTDHRLQGRPGEHAQRSPQPGEDETELANLCQRQPHRHRRPPRLPQPPDHPHRQQRFGHQHNQHCRQRRGPVRQHLAGIEQHARRDKKQHGERVAERNGFDGGPQSKLRLPDHHSGQKRPQGHRDPKAPGGTDGDAQRNHQHRQREQFSRPGRRHPVEHPGNEPPAPHQRQQDQRDQLEQRPTHFSQQGAGRATPSPGELWQQHQHQHGQHIFDHQPAHRDPAGLSLHFPPVRQHPRQDDRAGN